MKFLNVHIFQILWLGRKDPKKCQVGDQLWTRIYYKRHDLLEYETNLKWIIPVLVLAVRKAP